MYRRCLVFLMSLILLSCGGNNDQYRKKAGDEKGQKEEGVKNKESGQKVENLKPQTSNKELKSPVLDFDTYKDFLLDYGKQNPETLVEIETPLGKIKMRLYKQTAIHRANFVMLIKRGYFNTTVFYRVIDNFVVQGGNSDTWDTQNLKAEIGNYKMEPEFIPELFHKRGAVAMARNYTDNPDKLSSPYTFYIVQRGPIKLEGITYMRHHEGKTITDEMADHYMKYGGAPSLDMEHTVIGEVIEGMDVVDKIAKVETDDGDWPKNDVWMKMRLLD